MRLTVFVDGREAIPVRALPLIAGFRCMAPDKVARVFAHASITDDFNAVKTFHLSDGKPQAILPKEWERITVGIGALSERLKATETIEDESYPEWYEQSISHLPAGVFVWKDEFEAAFNSSYSTYRRIIIGEREGDRELNYAPMLIRTAFTTMIFEGFPEDLITFPEAANILELRHGITQRELCGYAYDGRLTPYNQDGMLINEGKLYLDWDENRSKYNTEPHLNDYFTKIKWTYRFNRADIMEFNPEHPSARDIERWQQRYAIVEVEGTRCAPLPTHRYVEGEWLLTRLRQREEYPESALLAAVEDRRFKFVLDPFHKWPDSSGISASDIHLLLFDRPSAKRLLKDLGISDMPTGSEETHNGAGSGIVKTEAVVNSNCEEAGTESGPLDTAEEIPHELTHILDNLEHAMELKSGMEMPIQTRRKEQCRSMLLLIWKKLGSLNDIKRGRKAEIINDWQATQPPRTSGRAVWEILSRNDLIAIEGKEAFHRRK